MHTFMCPFMSKHLIRQTIQGVCVHCYIYSCKEQWEDLKMVIFREYLHVHVYTLVRLYSTMNTIHVVVTADYGEKFSINLGTK